MVLAALYSIYTGLNYENMEMVNNTQFLETVEEPFETYNDNNHDDNSFEAFMEYIIVILSILTVVWSLCVVVIDIVLIAAIRRFKRLKCRQNSYIQLYVIFNMMYLVSPLVLWILGLIGRSLNIQAHYIYYIIDQLEISTVVFDFLFAFALSFHWLVTVLKPELGTKIKSFYKYFTSTMVVLGCIVLIIQVILCMTMYYHDAYLILCIVYFKVLIFNFILNIMNYKYKSSFPVDTEYSLIVSNIILYMWLPKIILPYSYDLNLQLICFRCFFVLNQLANIASFSPAVVILVVLKKKNKYIRMALAKMFCRKSARQYSNDQENLDESEENIDLPNTNTNISYNNSTNTITFPDLRKV